MIIGMALAATFICKDLEQEAREAMIVRQSGGKVESRLGELAEHFPVYPDKQRKIAAVDRFGKEIYKWCVIDLKHRA